MCVVCPFRQIPLTASVFSSCFKTISELCLGMDTAEQHLVHCLARQPAPATVRGEAGEDSSFRHQRKGSDLTRP